MTFWERIKYLFGWRPDPYQESTQEKKNPVPAPAPVRPGDSLPPVLSTPGAGQWLYFDKSGMGLITKDGLDLIQHFEGKYLKAYRDSVGVLTIGWGRIKYDDGRPVREGDTCTEEQALRWLLTDIWDDGAQYVRKMVDLDERLTPYQFSALVSMVFNRGAGRFDERLDDLIDASLKDGIFTTQEIKTVTDALLSYDYAVEGGKRRVLPGLTRRRYAEREMFMGKDWKLFSGSNWRSKIY